MTRIQSELEQEYKASVKKILVWRQRTHVAGSVVAHGLNLVAALTSTVFSRVWNLVLLASGVYRHDKIVNQMRENGTWFEFAGDNGIPFRRTTLDLLVRGEERGPVNEFELDNDAENERRSTTSPD